MIKLKFEELWQSKFGRKCQFFRFFGLMPEDNFYADYILQMKIFLYSPLHIPICYKDIWKFLEVEMSIDRLPNYQVFLYDI